MSNVNTGARSNFLPSKGLGNATSETQFSGSDGNILTVYIPLSGKLTSPEGVACGRFKVMVGGRVTTGTTSNWTPKLYWGNSTTISSNTGIAAPSAVSLASKKTNWHIEGTLFWDSTSKLLNGFFRSQIDTTTTAATTLSAVPTAVDLAAADVTTIGLSVTGIFGSTNASNTAFVDYFAVEGY